jgi:thioesterase domain-containing protein
MDGYARQNLRSLLSGVRERFAKIWLPPTMQKYSRNVDQAVVLRGAAFVHAIRNWRARHLVFDFKVLLFRASDRSTWGSHIEFDEDYGWRRYLTGTLTILDVPGNHLSIMEPPNSVLLGSLARPHLQFAPDVAAPVSKVPSVNC